MEVTRRIDKGLPVYHTEMVKKLFRETASKLSIDPMKSRALYKLATNDCSSAANKLTENVDARVLEYISHEDPDIIMDMRALNHRPTVYDSFFDQASLILDGLVETAVDDRRHDRILHLAVAMSAPDLYE